MSRNSSLQERKELLFGMYQENCANARHYEALRITVTSIVIAAAIGVVGVIGHSGLNCGDWPLSVGLMIIGVYGTVFTNAYFRNISRYQQIAEEFQNELDVLLFEPDDEVKMTKLRRIGTILAEAAKNPKVNLFRMFWPLTITVIGAVVTVYVLYPYYFLGHKCDWGAY